MLLGRLPALSAGHQLEQDSLPGHESAARITTGCRSPDRDEVTERLQQSRDSAARPL